jgi:uncharacterized coiled-coil DUF342 family protein
MRTEKMNFGTQSTKRLQSRKRNWQTILPIVFVSLLMLFYVLPASAHCDSYDGPVIKDATTALETNNVNLVLKWVAKAQEQEIIPLFNKTYSLKNGDKEVYAIVKKHFLETLVRLHRETEGAPYTGLKPAGTTKQIIQMTDQAIMDGSVDDFLVKFNTHLDNEIREKYQKVAELNKVKDNSIEQGRAYVEAYVDYTHTVEALHDIIEHGGEHTEHYKDINPPNKSIMEFKIPISLKKEHEELHNMLKQATQLPGKTGEAAKKVAELMHPHFVKEEEYALPPLGLLPLLSSGKLSEEMKQVLPMTDKLKAELPEMLAEHKQIVAALKVLVQHATAEQHPEVAEFAEELMLHAQTEEEVSYPTAILIGEYLKLKFN